ncbi:MAG: aminotransferase class III-fold pyridoxal phosphate-dependent enzyme [Polyangiales bacterium]
MANTVRPNAQYPVIEQSNTWYRRAEQLIPAGTHTLAKGAGQFVRGVAPKLLQRGRGARVWDVDGNEYLDLCMAVGPLSLGYADPDVDAAITEQLRDGISFSLVHPLEVEVAELLHEHIPAAEMVRFSKTGADVTSAAVRVARAYTGRNKVLCCGYHGWHDWYIAVTDRDRGVPDAVRDQSYTFEYNALETLAAAITDNVACVILEPLTFDAPAAGFLQQVRELCTRHGVVLIFDEMWTGFRIALRGAQGYFGVEADLACFSKAIANGMPLSALTGRRELMQLFDRDVFFFTTYGGETLSLAAAKATIHKLHRARVPEHITQLGERLQQGLQALVTELALSHVSCKGLPFRTMLTFDPSGGAPLVQKSFVQQELLRHGVLWNGFHNLSYAHTVEDIDYLLESYRSVLAALRDKSASQQLDASLRGEPLEPVFRRTHKFHTRPASTGAWGARGAR